MTFLVSETGRIDRDEVNDKIGVEDLLRAYGFQFRPKDGRHRAELESKSCPTYTPGHSEPAFHFNKQKKLWNCKKCATDGTVFDFIMKIDNSDFPAALARAAEIAGVDAETLPPDERKRRNEERGRIRLAERQAQQQEEESDDEKAMQIASRYWPVLALRDQAGERYLRKRGIEDVLHLGGRVRFDQADHPYCDAWSSDGAPSLAVHDLRGRGVAGVVRRRLPEIIERDRREVKAPTLTGAKGRGSMGFALNEIERGRDVIVTEGIVDTLTAMTAWPDAIALGANGTGPLPDVIHQAAERVLRARSRMLVVPHADERRQGEIAVLAGTKRAIAMGLRLNYDLIVVGLGGAKDLNDAWCAGWRPYV